MSLQDQVTKAIADAMRAKDHTRLDALRMLKAALVNREVEKARALDEAESLQVVVGLIKQRRESIRLFREGKRQDLVEKEEAELQILLSYLPPPFSQTEVEILIDQVIGESQATGPKDHGKVMKAAMAKIAGRAEGKAVSEIVKQKLSKMAS